jgi:hypothetical protein
VVTRSVAAGDVVSGNPARRVGRRDELACFAGHFERAYAWDLPLTATTNDGQPDIDRGVV